MRKFYKLAEAGTAPGGYVVRLDGKTLKTPLQKNMILSHEGLAQAIAAEWNAQGAEIIPATMPMMQLVSTMIDKAEGEDRAGMNAEVERYGASDLVCYFALHPAELVARHEAMWRPVVEWMATQGMPLKTVQGIQYCAQDPSTIRRMAEEVRAMPAAEFTALQAVMAATGSFALALAFVRGHLDAAQAHKAACVDEDYQLEKWGADEIAQQRLDRIRAELETAQRFLDYMRA